jgi:hypothetical protein
VWANVVGHIEHLRSLLRVIEKLNSLNAVFLPRARESGDANPAATAAGGSRKSACVAITATGLVSSDSAHDPLRVAVAKLDKLLALVSGLLPFLSHDYHP